MPCLGNHASQDRKDGKAWGTRKLGGMGRWSSQRANYKPKLTCSKTQSFLWKLWELFVLIGAWVMVVPMKPDSAGFDCQTKEAVSSNCRAFAQHVGGMEQVPIFIFSLALSCCLSPCLPAPPSCPSDSLLPSLDCQLLKGLSLVLLYSALTIADAGPGIDV